LIDIDPEQFVETAPCKFTRGPVCGAFSPLFSEDPFNAKIATLNKNMTKHPAWLGANAKIDSALTKVEEHEMAEILNDRKFKFTPFARVFKPNVWQQGPSSVPLSGMATLVSCPNIGDNTVWLLCFPMDELLGHGIATKDILQFLEQPTGVEFFGSAKLIRLMPNEVAFIPFGWLGAPLALEPPGSNQTKKGKSSKAKPSTVDIPANNYVPLVTFPIAHVPWAKALSEPVWRAIVKANDDFFSSKESEKMYSGRSEAFKIFCAAVASSD
jgi:hypothetical protein